MHTEPDNEFGPETGAGLEEALLPAQVHQAAGMVAGYLNLTLQDAYRWLEAYARSSGRDLETIACDVTDRRLRIKPEQR